MMKRTTLVALMLIPLTGMALLLPLMGMGTKGLDLKTITDGEYRAEGISELVPDAETYTQLSGDYKRIIRYSFKTGKEMETVFDVTTASGAKLDDIDGYIMSPDGRRILIQTKTESIYRHSFTADYYI